MNPIFAKLNLGAHKSIAVLDAPGSFEPVLADLTDVVIARRLPSQKAVSFALVFASKQTRVDEVSAALSAITPGDAVVWFAYPKGTSKKYRCDFNRDNGWRVLKQAGFETVRAVAIDQDWSALRFRRVEFIKSMTRTSAKETTAGSQNIIRSAIRKNHES
jgi:hypothetical protein